MINPFEIEKSLRQDQSLYDNLIVGMTDSETRLMEQEESMRQYEENYRKKPWMDASSMYGGPSLKWMDAYARNHDYDDDVFNACDI